MAALTKHSHPVAYSCARHLARITTLSMSAVQKDEQVVVRVPQSLLARAEELSERAGRLAGVTPSRAETVRSCLARGLDAMAADLARYAL